MNYLVIHHGNDCSIEKLDERQLLERLNEGYWGDDVQILRFDQIPDNSDTNTWGNYLIILEPRVIVPKARQVATEYVIE